MIEIRDRWHEIVASIWADGEVRVVSTPDDPWQLFDIAWLYGLGVHPGGLS